MLSLPDKPVKPPQSGRSGDWIVVALGSNLGRRESLLAAAREGLRAAGWNWTLASSIHESAAVGGPEGQGPYLNQILAGPLSPGAPAPRELLDLGLRIERQQGRVRRRRWEPRPLDIDLLLYGSLVMCEPELVVPHPRLAQRAFVLAPLAEILPRLRHPRTGLVAAEMLDRLGPCPPGGAPRRIAGTAAEDPVT